MASLLSRSLLGLLLLIVILDITAAMYVTQVRRLPLSSINYRQSGVLRKRALDQLEGTGFGGLGRYRRALDMLDGAGFSLSKRALDQLESTGFNFQKRALDSLDGGNFGFSKRSLDSLESGGFNFDKRALDSLESGGFNFDKRSLDSLEANGFGFQKKSLDSLESGGFNFDKRSRYFRVPADELIRLEVLKQEINDEITRRKLLAAAKKLDDQLLLE